MRCPRLEHTSAVFDGSAVDDGHIDTCDPCRQFMIGAAELRALLTRHRDAVFAAPARPRRRALWLVPAAAVLAIVVAFFAMRPAEVERGPFAGLDPGKRAVIYVKGRN